MHYLQCSVSRGTCTVHVNNTIISSSDPVVSTRVNERVSLHISYQHTFSTASARLEIGFNSTADWRLVERHRLTHVVECASGCGLHGCCVSNNTCACERGWTGDTCNVKLLGCEDSNGDLAGTTGVFYQDTTFGGTTSGQIIASASLAAIDFYYSGKPDPLITADSWSATGLGPLHRSTLGGMYCAVPSPGGACVCG